MRGTRLCNICLVCTHYLISYSTSTLVTSVHLPGCLKYTRNKQNNRPSGILTLHPACNFWQKLARSFTNHNTGNYICHSINHNQWEAFTDIPRKPEHRRHRCLSPWFCLRRGTAIHRQGDIRAIYMRKNFLRNKMQTVPYKRHISSEVRRVLSKKSH